MCVCACVRVSVKHLTGRQSMTQRPSGTFLNGADGSNEAGWARQNEGLGWGAGKGEMCQSLSLSLAGRQGHFVSLGWQRWKRLSQDGGGTGTICFRRGMATLMDVLLPRHRHHHTRTSAPDYSFAPLRLSGVLFGKNSGEKGAV